MYTFWLNSWKFFSKHLKTSTITAGHNSFSQVFFKSCDDLTAHFPEGALSAIVNKHSRTDWELYSETRYKGAKVILKPGNTYPKEGKISLSDSVKSFRKAHNFDGPMVCRLGSSAAKSV